MLAFSMNLVHVGRLIDKSYKLFLVDLYSREVEREEIIVSGDVKNSKAAEIVHFLNCVPIK